MTIRRLVQGGGAEARRARWESFDKDLVLTLRARHLEERREAAASREGFQESAERLRGED